MATRRSNLKYQDNGSAAAPATQAPAVALDQEYVLPGGGYRLPIYLPPLPVERFAPEVNYELRQQMLFDGEVAASLRALRDQVLCEGIQLVPARQGKAISNDDADFERAMELAEFIERNYRSLRKGLKKALEGMFEGAFAHGHKIAELVWTPGAGQDKGRILLHKLSQKAYCEYDFVFSVYWDWLGIRPRRPAPGISASEFIEAEKFALLNFLEQDEDARGVILLRSAYNAWCFKQLNWVFYKTFLDCASMPRDVATLGAPQLGARPPAVAAPVTRPDGSIARTREEIMAVKLDAFRAAGWIVINEGETITSLEPAAQAGAAFENAHRLANAEITKAITHQTLSGSESLHGTRAQAEVHSDEKEKLVTALRESVAEMLARQLNEKIIVYNFGEEAKEFAPVVMLGDSDRKDWAQDATAIQGYHGKVTKSQWVGLTQQSGMPAPQPDEPIPGYDTSAPAAPNQAPDNQPNQPPANQPPANQPPNNQAPKPGAQMRHGQFVSIRVMA